MVTLVIQRLSRLFQQASAFRRIESSGVSCLRHNRLVRRERDEPRMHHSAYDKENSGQPEEDERGLFLWFRRRIDRFLRLRPAERRCRTQHLYTADSDRHGSLAGHDCLHGGRSEVGCDGDHGCLEV